jgi:hypothetical protein
VAASVMAQNTNTVHGALVAKGMQDAANPLIIKTAAAESDVPVALSPLLDIGQLSRVKAITLSHFGTFSSNDAQGKFVPCTTCGNVMVMQVDVAMKYSDTAARFVRTGGMEVTIEKGLIGVKNVPGGIPGKEYNACGKASCSSIKVAGVDVNALRAKAVAAGFIQSGDRRWDRRVALSQRRLFFLALGAPLVFKASEPAFTVPKRATRWGSTTPRRRLVSRRPR